MTRFKPADGDFDFHTAFDKAIQLLNMASTIATDTKNIEGMLKVSSTWIDTAARMLDYPSEFSPPDDDEEEEQPHPVKRGKEPFGFVQSAAVIEKAEVGEKDEREPGADDDS